MTGPRTPDIRYRVDPGDVPPEKAARRLHLSIERFTELLPKLLDRGFPAPDPDTGMYGLEAIDLWRRDRDKLASAASNAQPSPPRRFGEKLHGGQGASGRA